MIDNIAVYYVSAQNDQFSVKFWSKKKISVKFV